MKLNYCNGLYHAVFYHRSGLVCMGFGPTMREALAYCCELVIAEDQRD